MTPPDLCDITKDFIRYVVFRHDNGPRSRLDSEARVSVNCQFLELKSSFDFSLQTLSAIFFGYKTSLGTACTFEINDLTQINFIFEVGQQKNGGKSLV